MVIVGDPITKVSSSYLAKTLKLDVKRCHSATLLKKNLNSANLPQFNRLALR